MFKLAAHVISWLTLLTLCESFILDCNNGQHAPKQFKYSVKNILLDPHFFHTITLNIQGCHNDTVVIRYMEAAVDADSDSFQNFSMTYYPKWGYYVTAINGMEEVPGVSLWQLIEHTTGESKEVGASTYVPQPNDHLAFNLTNVFPPYPGTK